MAASVTRTKYDGAKCETCGTGTRRKYAMPRGTKGRIQHSRWWVCEKGHQLMRKG